MMDLFRRFWTDESGQGLTEYALIIAIVSVGLIAVLYVFRDAIGAVFDAMAAALQGQPTDSGYTPGGGGTS